MTGNSSERSSMQICSPALIHTAGESSSRVTIEVTVRGVRERGSRRVRASVIGISQLACGNSVLASSVK